MRSEIFHGEVDIEYILTLSTNHSDHLVLSFPGLFGGMPGSVGYLQTINKLGCNALFIKCDYRKTDFAKSRLTCINRDFVIERSIMALVDKIKQDVGAVNVIATGSSMGGWCALYYGLKYDCDIICGSPESFEEPMSVKYMAGGTTPEDKAWAGGLLSETIKNAGKRNYSKKISISFGKGEPAWTNKRLGKRLLDELESEGLNYENTLLNYSDHNSVAKLFPYFLENRLMVYLGMAETSELDIRNDAMKLSDALNDEFRGLLPLLDTLESTDMNIDIVGQKSYMGNDIMTYMRNFLYATRGYFWYPGYIQPVPKHMRCYSLWKSRLIFSCHIRIFFQNICYSRSCHFLLLVVSKKRILHITRFCQSVFLNVRANYRGGVSHKRNNTLLSAFTY